MVQTNNNTDIIPNRDLSIQIGLNGLSFCVLNKTLNAIEILKDISFEKKANHLEILDKLLQVFDTTEALQGSFNEVIVIHENDLSVLVPKLLFDENCLADYLKFNSKIIKTDLIAFDNIDQNNSVNVYVPYVNINNFIYDKFGSFTYKHVSTVLICKILEIESTENENDDTKVYINIGQDHFEVLVIKNKDLLLYNTFRFFSKEDFIYYILFTAEQLKINPETFHLIFIGNISFGDDLYNIAFKYIRNVSFGNRPDNYSYLQKPKSNYSNFTLLNSF